MVAEAKAVEQEADRDVSIPVDDEKEVPRSTGHVSHISLHEFSLAALIGLVCLPLLVVISFCCGFILCIMAMPLVLVSYLVVRLLQPLTKGDAYFKVTHLKTIIRFLMLECMLMLLIPLGIFYQVACNVSKIQHITVYDLSIKNWIQVTCMITGLYALSFCLTHLVGRMSPPMVWQYERGVNAAQAASEIIQCLIFWWATTLVLKHVPPLQQHHILGLPTQRWIKVVIFVIIGIDTIAFCCNLITFLLHIAYKCLRPTLDVKSTRHYWVEEILCRKHVVYWADGLRKNIIFIFGSMVLFLSWNSYFGTHLNATPENKKMVRFGTMALASLLILAVLWLMKSCIVLTWKANQVYTHLRPRLLENQEELYFLGILGRHKFDILSIGGQTPLTTKPLDSNGHGDHPINSNEQQKDPGHKKQSTIITSLEQYMRVKFRRLFNIKLSKDVLRERDEEKYHDLKSPTLIEMILNRDGINEFVDSILQKGGGLIYYPIMSEIVRDDLYIRKGQKNEKKDVQKDVQKDEQKDVKGNDSEISCATLHDLQKMAQYFLRAQPTLSSDNYVPSMLHHLTNCSVECKNLDEYLEQLIKDKTIHQKSKSDSQAEHEWQWFKRLVNKQSRRLSSKATMESTKSSSEENMKLNTSSFNEIKEAGKSSSEHVTSSSNQEIKLACESSPVGIEEPVKCLSNKINKSNNSPSNETDALQKREKETLKAWLENARGTCMELANTLHSAEEVVNCLDNIISGLLIGATFIIWLLLTGLATTKILVLIASPLLAATFIFGDTCKSLFQGIIFAYVCHPFNVGDLVIIDDKMMEVKILGVWRTIFVEIGKSDEVIYPNSELANKKIINYKSDFEWNDCLEFSLKTFDSNKIAKLRTDIENIRSEDEKCSLNHISTEVLATEEDVKVVVHLKYNTDNQHGMTLYERLQEKRNLRSVFSIKIRYLVDEYNLTKK